MPAWKLTETAWEHLPPSWRAAFGRAYAKQPGKWKGTRIKRDTDGWQQSDTTTNTTTNAGNESGRGEDAGGEKVQAVRQALNNYLSAEEVESLPLSKIFLIRSVIFASYSVIMFGVIPKF